MKYTKKQFDQDFPSDDACLDRLLQIKFGSEPTCPHCNKKTKFHRVTGRRQYACQYCGHHVAPCAGTVFEKSSTSLKDWFYAMYLFTSTRHGVAAKELQRQLGVTYKTAWRMAHQLRQLMAQADIGGTGMLHGQVEIDETMIGGHRPGKRGRGAAGKTVVMGMTEREGNVKTKVVPNVKLRTLEPVIHSNVAKGSIVYTDELGSYHRLARFGYGHGVVNHRAGQYVKGAIHTNSIEGYWSRLKNSIRGTHIHVSKKHLPKYLAEFSYRYNTRKQDCAQKFNQMLCGIAMPRREV